MGYAVYAKMGENLLKKMICPFGYTFYSNLRAKKRVENFTKNLGSSWYQIGDNLYMTIPLGARPENKFRFTVQQ